ncbi:MAG TPA: radical SAM family heme chaperone HemW [Bryobacterales bacterium]|nr:radical SAM family heme chaperone HemW [Bryobacterales bacterium]
MRAGVYISIPFCAQKCTYCNFASGVFPEALLREYLAALEAEIAAESWNVAPDTLYLGGGTPSLLDPQALGRILRRLPAAEWAEATLEAAPGTVTSERTAAWRLLGIDRVSLGVQSFVPREIAATGRKHSPQQVAEEVARLRQHGISEINIDLIAGLPHQTAASWRESLDWIERLQPPHVSVYMLEADEDSRLGREILRGGARYGAGAVPDDAQIADFYLQAVERLERLGIRRYEISNFARPGCESAHNLKYWRLEPYRGFGADAHSFDGHRRWSNVETPAEYVERFRAGASPVAASEPVDPRRAMEEHFFVGLRQTAGIEPCEEEWRRFAEPIRRLGQDGLLRAEGSRLRLTDRGVLFSNEVFQEFIET